MARIASLIGLGFASTLMITAPAFASAPSAPAAAARPGQHALAQQPAAPKVAASKPGAAKRPNTHLARATLRNGKKVTYNCNLAGNKTKQACKG